MYTYMYMYMYIYMYMYMYMYNAYFDYWLWVSRSNIGYGNYFKTYSSNMRQQIMYNMEETRSLFDRQMGEVSCIIWLYYFHWFSIDLKKSDNRFQKSQPIPTLLFCHIMGLKKEFKRIICMFLILPTILNAFGPKQTNSLKEYMAYSSVIMALAWH